MSLRFTIFFGSLIIPINLKKNGLDVEHKKDIIISDDPIEFAKAISSILHGEDYNSLGENLYQKVLDKYTLKTLEEECTKVLSRLESKFPKH